MSDGQQPNRGELPLEIEQQIDRLSDEFETAWRAGQEPRIEDYLDRLPEVKRQRLLEELLATEFDLMQQDDRTVDIESYRQRFPGDGPAVDAALASQRRRRLDSHDENTIPIPPVGATVQYFGDYELLEEIARGGMGVVYKARQVSLNRIVALKMILAGQLAGEDAIRRFHTEAEAAAALDHPNIVPIYEVGVHEGHHYFSMGFVEGESLGTLIRKQPLPPRDAAQIVKTAADAIAYAHGQGVIHRDLKPANILMDVAGQPRIVDFGLARRVADTVGLTASGDILGTPSYMSPEQARGEIKGLTAAADVYGLGAVLYAIITGRPPFQAASHIDVLNQVLDKEPVSPRQLNESVPRDLETICFKCLEKTPLKRYESARVLADDLARFIDGRPIKARPVGFAGRALRWAKRNPAVATVAALVLSIAVFGPAVAIQQAILRRDLQQTLQARLDAQIATLLSADIQALPSILRDLETDLDAVAPKLKQLQTREELGEDQRLRVRLALVKLDESIATELADQILITSLENVPVVATELQPFRERVRGRLWQVFGATSSSEEQRFRAGISLATLDANSARWSGEDDDFIVCQLVATNPEIQPSLRNLLVTRFPQIVDPLERVFEDKQAEDSHREAAARALAFYLENDTARLARLASVATPGQHAILFPLLRESADPIVKDTLGDLAAEQPSSELTQWQRTLLGKRRAGAAISLLRLGEIEKSYAALQIQDDPESLTQFVHGCKHWGVTAGQLVQSLRQARDVHSRSAILLALGDYQLAELDAAERDALVEQLTESYRSDPSSAIHGATGWLLRQWGFDDEVTKVDHTPLPYDDTGIREWYVVEVTPKPTGMSSLLSGILGGLNWAEQKVYFTLVVFPPGKYLMGSPEGTGDWRQEKRVHRVTFSRPLAVSAHETTWAQYNALMGGQMHYSFQRMVGRELMPEEPVSGVLWFRAVEYCRELTQQVGWPESEQCYEDPQSLPEDENGNPKHSVIHLDRHGFRLLTEAEWEFMCRSGTSTEYNFGSDPEMLKYYAWFLDNSENRPHAVGQLRPNLRGLFDLHGNALEWCNDSYSITLHDAIDPMGAEAGWGRVYRGGSFPLPAWRCRSAVRNWDDPNFRSYNSGFRVATVPSRK